MERHLINNFAGGIDHRFQNANANTASDLSNVDITYGNARVCRGSLTGIGLPYFTSFGEAGDKAIVTQQVSIGGVAGSLEPTATAGQFTFMPVQNRSTYVPETCTAYAGQIYLAPLAQETDNVWDYASRWDGVAKSYTFTYRSDLTTSGQTAWQVSGTPSPEIQPGWLVWYGIATAVDADGNYGMYGDTIWYGSARIVRTQSPTPASAPVIWTTTVSSPGEYNRFVVVNVDRIGIPAAVYAPTVTAVSGGTLAAGTYEYIYRYVSATLKTAGVPSPLSSEVTTDASNGTVTVAFGTPPALPACADTIEVYRSKKNADGTWNPFYLVGLVTASSVSGGYKSQDWGGAGSSVTFTDTGIANGDELETDAYHRVRPGRLRQIRYYNGRLYAVEESLSWRLRFSCMGGQTELESWPTDVADLTTGDTSAQYLGGYVDVGESDPILAMVPEGGAYGNTGLMGSNLLIFKRNRTYRWYGTTWADFYLADGPRTGCRDGRSVQNCDGVVYWMGERHVMRLTGGSMTPEIISYPIWPDGAPDSTQPWHSLYWERKYWLLNYNAGLYAFDTVTGAWTKYATTVPNSGLGILAANDTYKRRHPILTGLDATHSDHVGLLFADDDAANYFYAKSALLPLISTVDGLPKAKRIKRLWACIRNNTGATQTLTLSLFTDEGATAAQTATLTVPYVAAHPLQYVAYYPSPDLLAYTLQVGLGGTITPSGTSAVLDFSVDWIQVENECLASKR